MITEVNSGGQTGVDQTGLEVAREAGIPTGGVAPRGYMTDEGNQPITLSKFGLTESIGFGYAPRTRQNVINTDGTVWFGDQHSPGGKLTINSCKAYRKPVIINPTVDEFLEWVMVHKVQILNVAGNRKRTNPQASVQCREVLTEAFRRLKP